MVMRMRHPPLRRCNQGGWKPFWAKAVAVGVWLGLCLAPAALPLAATHPYAAATLVVFNKNQPQSAEIARHYAKQRGVPLDHLIELSCSIQEEITRADYNAAILKPIREFAQQHHFLRYGPLDRPDGKGRQIVALDSALKFIVICYGVPLKIAHDPEERVGDEFKDIRSDLLTNAASVDSELANLPSPQQPITALLVNPLFKRSFSETPGWQHRLVCVSRLDGPTPELARKLVDDALKAEKIGLHGRAFFDLRGIAETNPGYKTGDAWIRGARKLFEEKGWEIVSDENEAVFGDNVDAADCAVYAGWYAADLAGPFKAAGFRFRPGAIGYHIHSASADTLRSPDANWSGPLLARGVAATLGCVYEPYLQMTPNVDVFFQRLLEGCDFGEAAYSCQQFLSWMTTVVGDPLYRPFALSNDARIADFENRCDSLDQDEKAGLAWAYRLKSRQLFLAGKKDEALQLARDQAARLKRRPIWLGLANLYRLTGDHPRAAEAAKIAESMGKAD